MTSRRTFLKSTSATVLGGALFGRTLAAHATPLGLPLGIQLYSVRQQLMENYAQTLTQVGSLGYREVEAAGFYKHPIAEVKQAMKAANLRCVSSHYPYPELSKNFDEILAFNKELGVEFIICSSPGRPPASTATGRTPLTIDDWRWNADQFNLMASKLASSGIKFGYHNHVVEFAHLDGGIPFVEIMHRTDPKLVSIELDCGWAAVAGVSPVDILRDYPHRIVMLHVKDFVLPSGTAVADTEKAKVTEMGRGTIDYAPIFAQAAKTQTIRHAFVEQEAFDMPWMDSLKVDADYLNKFHG